MRVFGYEITRAKAAVAALSPANTGDAFAINGSAGWWPIVRESFAGAWQRNITVDRSSCMSFHADFACKTLIARDIGKLRIKLMKRDAGGIWSEAENPAYGPVLRKPNRFQTRNQFWEYWILSKLNRGNAYVLKERDERNVVVRLYVLDPGRVVPLVAPDGGVYYELKADNLSGIDELVIVPASEIIHDRMNCLFHPLVGLPPVYASGLAATQGLAIQNNSARFFANNSSPGGVLTAPGTIDNITAERFKKEWEEKFSGNNVGRVAVLGDGLKYEKMSLTAVEAQMIEQLKWSSEIVCSTYHVPPYKIGIGSFPPYTNVQSANIEYYSQALQSLIEDAEECLDVGLGIGYASNSTYGAEFDVENLLRMDSVTQMEVLDKGKNILKPDEARRKLDLPPVPGGNSVYRQQQDYSLEALAKRDAKADPFAAAPSAAPASDPTPANDDAEPDETDVAATRTMIAWAMESKFAMQPLAINE